MKGVRTAALVAALLGLLLLTVGVGAFTTTESQRTVEVYSDENPGTFVEFEVTDRDESACALTFEITNNIPAPRKTVGIDSVSASGFGARVASFSEDQIRVGESAEVRVRIHPGHTGRGTIDVYAEISGDDTEIEMEEETWVYCEPPEDENNGSSRKPVGPPAPARR